MAENTTRTLLLLSLLPLGLLVVGLAARGSTRGALGEEWLFLGLAGAFYLMQLKLSTDYRDFSVMKAIYVYPALLAPIRWTALGLERLGAPWHRLAWAGLAALSLVSMMEAGQLFAWLARP